MEILAHASAPSSKKDDDRFKRQALAYSTFRPGSSLPVLRNVQQGLIGESTGEGIEGNARTPARATLLDHTFYLDNTQLAYSALESQLITSSLDSADVDEDTGGEDEDPTPRPSQSVPNVLPPDESSEVSGSLSSSRKRLRSPSPVSSRSHGQGNLLSSPSARLRARQDLTLGYIGGISTADVWATPSRPLPPVPQGGPQPPPQEPSSSSPGDDLPSQLPSSYSLSDISSDNHSNHDAIGRLMSSPWANLPRGTASQDGSARSDRNSNHGMTGQLTSSPWEDLPRGTAPEKDPAGEASSGKAGNLPSSRSRRANTSAPIQPSSIRNGVSSHSLDRACIPLTKRSQGKAADFLLSKSNSGVSSRDGSKTLQQQSRDQKRVGPGPTVSSPRTSLPESSPPNDIPASSSAPQSPEIGGPDPGEVAQGPPISHLTPANQPRTSETGVQQRSSAPPTGPPGSSTPIQKPPPRAPSSATTRVPETNLASKRRKHVEFSTPKSLPKPEDLSKLGTLSTCITPGPPATSSERFTATTTTHVTPYLREQYFDKPELENRYRPALVTRGLRPSERGHWLVDPGSWALELQLRFWNFLEKQIGSGKAGWGVWCVRGEDEEEGETAAARDEGELEVEAGVVRGRAQMDLGTVRVFCWGEVVGHVYLLLYVASGSKVRKVEPCWVDAGGDVVIRI